MLLPHRRRLFPLTANTTTQVTATNNIAVARRVISGTAGEDEAVESPEADGFCDEFVEVEGADVTLAVGLGTREEEREV